MKCPSTCDEARFFENLDLDGVSKDITAYLSHPQMEGIRSLHIENGDKKSDEVGAIAASAHLRNLKRLKISDSFVNKPDSIAKFFHASHLQALQSLSFHYCRINDLGAAILAKSPYLSRLTELDLSQNDLGAQGATTLASSPIVRSLVSLDLSYNEFGDLGAEVLAKSTHLSNLKVLDLAANRMMDPGAWALASSGAFPSLRELSLWGNGISPGTVEALPKTKSFQKLDDLNLGNQNDPNLCPWIAYED